MLGPIMHERSDVVQRLLDERLCDELGWLWLDSLCINTPQMLIVELHILLNA